MNCFPELTYSIYADGELTREEARHVESHLAVCPSCRVLVNALRTENRLLTEILQETREDQLPVMAKPARRFDMLWTAIALVAAAASLKTALNWLGQLQPPAAAAWMNPFHSTFQWSVFFKGLFYLIEEGATMLFSAWVYSSVLIVILSLGAGALFLIRRRLATVSMLATLIMTLGLALPAYALQTRRGNTVTVPTGQTLDDTLLAAGNTVTIDGVITGDLIVAAKRVAIRGTVKGDVISFAQDLELEGTVGGNVYSFGRQASIRGRGRSFVAFAESFRLLSEGRADADIMAFASETTLDGSVERDAMTFGGSTELRGNVGRNLTARTDHITLLAPARVGGNFIASVGRKAKVHVDPGVSIAGKRETRRKAEPARYLRPGFYVWAGIKLVGALLTGLLLRWAFPGAFSVRLETAGAVLRNMGVGFLILVATPVAVVIIAITLVGLPIALATLALWFVGLYLAKIFVAALIGQGIKPPAAGKTASFAFALLIGLVVLFVATQLPYVGGVIRFLVLLLGLGVAFYQARTRWRRPGVPAPSHP